MSATCYRPNTDGSIANFQGVNLCGKYLASNGYGYCCFAGDTCLEDGICYAGDRNATGSAGYYISLCSDPTYKDASCSQHCTTLTKGDIVYSQSQTHWSCCGADGNGDPNCSNPTDETFSAPGPNKLQADATATSTSSTSSTSTSSTSSSTASRTPGALAANSSSSGLSTGAKAGIGVGVAVGVLAAIALLAWFLIAMRRSRRAHGARGPTEESKEPMRTQYNSYASEAPAYSEGSAGISNDKKYTHSPHSQPPAELASPPLQGQSQVHELG